MTLINLSNKDNFSPEKNPPTSQLWSHSNKEIFVSFWKMRQLIMFRSQRALFLSFSSGSDSSFVVAFLLRAVRPKTATRLRRQRPRWDGPIVPGTHLNQVHHCFPLDFYRPVRKFTCFTRCRVRRLNCRCVANFFKVLNTWFNWKLLEFF